MNAERMARIDRALKAALEAGEVEHNLPDAEDRQLLQTLIEAAHSQLPGLEQSALAHESLSLGLSAALANDGQLRPGTVVGAFRLVRPIGTGGMGTVFLAERLEGGFKQRVALKVLAGTGTDPALVQLFQRERELLAQLEHPGIARLIDGGITDGWRPWFAMEYIDGIPVHEYTARNRLDVNARLELFVQACDAIDYAHRQLILHRDIKPANLLVAADGQVRLVDFGLGRALETIDAARNSGTTIAAGRMTPDYASPEQARCEPVTVASEVYQLGLVLFRLLCGKLPYSATTTSAYELARTISNSVIPRPSECWRTGNIDPDVTAQFVEGPKSLRRRLQGDLDNIVLMALAREPKHRYTSVEALAEDLRRHRQMLPVRARAATRRYRADRFIRRHALGVGLTAVVVLVLAAGLLALALQSAELARERDRAVAAATSSERLSDAMAGMIRFSDVDRGADQLMSAGQRLEQYRDHVRRELAGEPEARMRLLSILGDAMLNLKYWAQARETLHAAVELSRQMRGQEHPETRVLTLKLAEALAFDNRFGAGDALLTDLLEARHPTGGNDERAAAADSHYLRGFLRTYHLPRSDPLFLQGIADLETALGLYRELRAAPHPDIATAMHALGLKHPDSEIRLEMVRAAMEMTLALHGEQHPVTAARLAELALVYDSLGDYRKAAEVGRRAHAAHVEVLGERHPESLTILSNLAGSLREAGQLEQAVEMYRQVHRIRQQTLPQDHLLLAYTAHGLGNTLRQMREYEQSERWLREALRLCLLHDSRNEAVTRVNLSKTLQAAGRTTDALEQQRAALKLYVQINGAGSDAVRAANLRLQQLERAAQDALEASG
ncbi:MAG: serine/threonine-protein kinase [Xanthomonadaceae bacterium]|nr:serine/threonine-protein kinase [Xanthomonadaceae bacterium]